MLMFYELTHSAPLKSIRRQRKCLQKMSDDRPPALGVYGLGDILTYVELSSDTVSQSSVYTYIVAWHAGI